VVGHPDTGYTPHPEIAGPRLRIGDGYDFEDDRQDARDPLAGGLLRHPGHGTSTSSLIISAKGLQAGSAGPAFVSGTAPGASLIPIRATKSVVLWSMSRLTRAIHHAVDRGAHAISISLGGPVPSIALHNAVREAESRGVIVLCAAGNQVRFVVFPAAFDEAMPWPPAASTTSRGPVRAATAVDITAPGSSVRRALERREGVEQYEVQRQRHLVRRGAHRRHRGAVALVSRPGALVARYGKDRLAAVFKQLLQAVLPDACGMGLERLQSRNRERARIAQGAVAGQRPGAGREAFGAAPCPTIGPCCAARPPAGAGATVGVARALAEL
jgi:thermitase